ncbi:DUF480 domain-containing protein [Nocardioides nanhaiensis]|uniref:Methyltransferase domain-containing protein n=1 Tax=Nocardioides nanhaiensis TaxID=1476871 RepID=A0ABP8WI48_9ACTN
MSDLPVLSADEQRVLGSLLEKQVTVPGSYPMTLSGLRTACNQSSSREPVVDYDEQLVESTARGLKDRSLLRIVWSDSGRRTLKYHQALAEVLDLADDERALLTVLLLRGPQPPGALRSRTERLHAFADRDEVEACLQRMAQRSAPLVQQLPRGPREQDARWVHLLGETAVAPSAATTASALESVDTEVVLAADGAEGRDARVREGYGAIAADYAAALADELDHLPFERWLLDRVALEGGPVVEVGCGPGHVTDYLATLGADATGIDLSPGMVAEARRRYPDGQYEVGDLRRLMRPTNADGWYAVLAWYSLIHLAASELPEALASLARPLRPGGLLLVALHAGSGVRRHDEWFEHPVSLDFVFHEPAGVVPLLEQAGLADVEWYRRGPVAARGETTERLYLVARRPTHG